MSISKIINLKIVDSTNQYALDNIAQIADGSLIVAEQQTAGRGRRGKKWVSDNSENLYASFVVKKICQPVTYFSWLASLATIETIRTYSKSINDIWIKWPNDIFCTHRKIAGSLCEVKNDNQNKPVALVIGIGVNLNMPQKALEKIDQPATSLSVEIKENINLEKFKNLLFENLQKYYGQLQDNKEKELYDLWKNDNFLIGKSTTILMDNSISMNGKILDIDKNGNLVFKTKDKIMSLCSGDVRIDKNTLKDLKNG